MVTVIAIGVGIFVLPSQTLAQNTIDTINQNLIGMRGIDASVQWFVDLLRGLACRLIQFAIVAISVMMIVYGIMFLKSRGSPQGMVTARKALLWGLLGE